MPDRMRKCLAGGGCGCGSSYLLEHEGQRATQPLHRLNSLLEYFDSSLLQLLRAEGNSKCFDTLQQHPRLSPRSALVVRQALARDVKRRDMTVKDELEHLLKENGRLK